MSVSGSPCWQCDLRRTLALLPLLNRSSAVGASDDCCGLLGDQELQWDLTRNIRGSADTAGEASALLGRFCAAGSRRKRSRSSLSVRESRIMVRACRRGRSWAQSFYRRHRVRRGTVLPGFGSAS